MTSDKREKAIKYLTEEIRSLRMAPQINGCGPENWAEQLEVMETCLEAVRGHGNQPLALEQLRKMGGQPVWCKSLINGKSEWAIIRIVEMSKTWFIALAGASQGFGDKDTYGKTWLAYAYPPAHIDREAMSCAGCDYLDRENVPCAHCVRAAGYADYYKPMAELEKRFRGVRV